jgi:hypothetical protein
MNSICKFQKCSFMSFSASKRGNFFQEGPTLGNQYKEDPYLRRYLESELPFDVFFLIFLHYFSTIFIIFYHQVF